MKKRILLILLAAVLTLSILPVRANADKQSYAKSMDEVRSTGAQTHGADWFFDLTQYRIFGSIQHDGSGLAVQSLHEQR